MQISDIGFRSWVSCEKSSLTFSWSMSEMLLKHSFFNFPGNPKLCSLEFQCVDLSNFVTWWFRTTRLGWANNIGKPRFLVVLTHLRPVPIGVCFLPVEDASWIGHVVRAGMCINFTVLRSALSNLFSWCPLGTKTLLALTGEWALDCQLHQCPE